MLGLNSIFIITANMTIDVWLTFRKQLTLQRGHVTVDTRSSKNSHLSDIVSFHPKSGIWIHFLWGTPTLQPFINCFIKGNNREAFLWAVLKIWTHLLSKSWRLQWAQRRPASAVRFSWMQCQSWPRQEAYNPWITYELLSGKVMINSRLRSRATVWDGFAMIDYQ